VPLTLVTMAPQRPSKDASKIVRTSPYPRNLASHFPPSSARSPSRSPSHSPARLNQLSRLLSADPLLSTLSPSATLDALSGFAEFDGLDGESAETLRDIIALASPSDKELATRAALAHKKLLSWSTELRQWEWPCSPGDDDTSKGFQVLTDGEKREQRRRLEQEGGRGRLKTAMSLATFLDIPGAISRSRSKSVSSTPRSPEKQQNEPASPVLRSKKSLSGFLNLSGTITRTRSQSRSSPKSPSSRNGGGDEEYWGSLPASLVEAYEARCEIIRDEMEQLGLEDLKSHVLGMYQVYFRI
jgi:hypothetical protein